jgi:hypothetical protein
MDCTIYLIISKAERCILSARVRVRLMSLCCLFAAIDFDVANAATWRLGSE